MIKFWFQKRKKKAYIYYHISLIVCPSLDRKLNMFLVHIISLFTFTCV